MLDLGLWLGFYGKFGVEIGTSRHTIDTKCGN